MGDKIIPVQVAVRCRPLIPREQVEACQICVQFVPEEPQLILGKDKSFTYDFVFHPDVPQRVIYDKTVSKLVQGVFKGYNATVLAYGQTGSGKTHTMGGGQAQCTDPDDRVMGIIPRVIQELFDGIAERTDCEFTVKASYMELYKEDLLDLLVPANKREDTVVIREDAGGIRVTGLTERVVTDAKELLACLEEGSLGRTTGSTAMNSQSSRSHAIFTVHVERTNKNDSNDYCKAKFHLVDLAGSERAKKTQAEGERFKEGVNINKGLLALGNVISALGDETQKRSHVPYRDSKLTRLLQDSLGGNSHTVMIACISPADSNMEETLSTLRYADRARRIKNKPVVNRDPQAAEIMRLKQLVQDLQMKMLQSGLSGNNSFSGQTVTISTKDSQERIQFLEQENRKLSQELAAAVDQNTEMCEKVILAEIARDNFRHKLEALKRKMRLSMTILNGSVEDVDQDEHDNRTKEQLTFVRELQEHIDAFEEEDVKDLQEMEEEYAAEGTISSPNTEPGSLNNSASEAYSRDHVLRQAKLGRELTELNKMLEKKQELASQMARSEDKINAMKDQYETTMKNLEGEVDSLQREKEDLTQQLVSAKANANSGKLSEQRRKRLQELEQQISQLRKKMLEQAKVLKIKEQSDRQVTKLNQEIQSMKQQRVKLMKQLKEDSDKFQKWKMQKDKEVMQLKAKDRKRQVEMVKREQMHTRQQNVLKRKAEEAVAANKRLKEALSRQKAAAEDRANKQEKSDMSGIGVRVRKFLSQEIEVMVSIEGAKHHLESLMSDRKALSQQLTELKHKLSNTPPAKKKMLNNSQGQDADEEKEQVRQQVRMLEQEIDLRNAHISDLQQKLMDADQDDKSKSRWNGIHTMVEAKCAMKYLLNTAVASKVEQSKQKSQLGDMRQMCEETTKQAEAAEDELKKARKDFDEELVGLKRENENKVLYLLNQLKNTTTEDVEKTLDENIKERLRFQEEEIERLSDLQDKLEKQTEECDALKKELTVANYKLSSSSARSLMPTIDPGQETSFFSPSLCTQVKTVKLRNRSKSAKAKCQYLSEEEGEEEDDEVCDPDWKRGLTPGPGARWYSKTRKEVVADESAEELPVSCKPSVGSGMTCKCKGRCQTVRCKCKEARGKCGSSCGCSESRCQNRATPLPESTTQDSETSSVTDSSATMNVTFNLTNSGEEDAVSSSEQALQENNGASRVKAKSSPSQKPKYTFVEAENRDPTRGPGRKRKLFSNTGSFFPDI